MHIASLVKIPCYLLKLSSGNDIMGVSRADNSVKIWWNWPISNPKPDIYNINTHTKIDENPLVYSSYHPETKNGRKDGWTYDGRIDTRTSNVKP